MIEPFIPPHQSDFVGQLPLKRKPRKADFVRKLTSSSEEAYIGGSWYSSTIYLNTNLNGVMNEYKSENGVIEKVILHELGHALKLAHPKHSGYTVSVPNGRGAYANDNCVCALMNQGRTSLTNRLTCLYPKWHDIINLNNKWK